MWSSPRYLRPSLFSRLMVTAALLTGALVIVVETLKIFNFIYEGNFLLQSFLVPPGMRTVLSPCLDQGFFSDVDLLHSVAKLGFTRELSWFPPTLAWDHELAGTRSRLHG